MSYVCQSILCLLMHVPWSTCESRGKNDHLSKLMAVGSIIIDGISKVSIVVYPKLFLMADNLSKPLTLDLGIHVYQVLMKKISLTKEVV